MRASCRAILCGLWVPALVACAAKDTLLSLGGGDDASSIPADDASGSSSSGSSSGSSEPPSGTFQNNSDGAVMVAPSDCKAGEYEGAFTGSYSSGLIAGIALSVTGNVDLTLNQAGTPMMMCVVQGEGFESCSDVFPVSGGSVTGVANQLAMIGDAGIGGFPYYCTLGGTLDCAKKLLVDGWIQCTYCVGPLADGGASCTIGIGGHFAGPVTANYDAGSHAFVGGTWNGAEALAGNDGAMPGPDGGPISDYLALDGGYGFLGKYGGSGDWGAALQP